MHDDVCIPRNVEREFGSDQKAEGKGIAIKLILLYLLISKSERPT
jgi:hypothetical protein